MSVVIFEGLPASGKTSVANHLRDNFNYTKVNESLGYLGDIHEINDQQVIFNETLHRYKIARYILGDSVIDRGYPSLLAWDYCSEKLGYEYNLIEKKEWVRKAIKNDEIYEPKWYVYMMINPKTSLTRRKRRTVKKDVWSGLEGMRYCAEFYDDFFNKKEIRKKTLFINAEDKLESVILDIISKIDG